MDPLTTLKAYRAQAVRRALWFLIAAAFGLVAALAFRYGTDFTYPAWRIGILAWGLVFLPWFFIKGSRKNSLSMKDAVKAYKEIKRQRRD